MAVSNVSASPLRVWDLVYGYTTHGRAIQQRTTPHLHHPTLSLVRGGVPHVGMTFVVWEDCESIQALLLAVGSDMQHSTSLALGCHAHVHACHTLLLLNACMDCQSPVGCAKREEQCAG